MKYWLDKDKFNIMKGECKGLNQQRLAYLVCAKYINDSRTKKTWVSKISNAVQDNGSNSPRKTKKRQIEEADLEKIISTINYEYNKNYDTSDLIKSETTGSPHPVIFWKISDIYEYYESLDSNSIISIVSSNGFLEADKPEIFSRMLEQIQKKVEVRYYYPENPGNKSLKNYTELLNKYKECLSPEDVKAYVWGFAIPPQFAYLFGWDTRYIVISRWVKGRTEQIVQNAFLYTEALSNESSSSKSKRIWIHLSKNSREKYHLALCENAEPVRDIGVHRNRLNPALQKAYQSVLEREENLIIYRNICKAIDSSNQTLLKLEEKINEKMLEKILRTELLRRNPIIKILDIGSGDGHLITSVFDYIQERLGVCPSIRFQNV